MKNLQEKIENLRKQREELAKEIQNEFPDLVKPLFEKYPKIQSVGFTGYTPYFNDGEECIYSVNTDYVDINGESEDDIETIDWKMKYPDKYLEVKDNKDLDWELFRGIQEFKEVLKQIPDEFYKEIFGDHKQITLYSDGKIEVEEFDHD